MKIPCRISFIIFAVLIPLITYAGGDEKKVAFKEIQYNFGTLKQGISAEHIFEYQNVSKDTIYLDHPKASCGCTAALMSDEILLPGKTGTVKVQFTPPIGSHGKIVKTVTMYTKPDGQTLQVLTINAKVVGDLEPSEDFLRFNAVAGEKQSLKVSVKSISDKDISLDNISASLMEYRDTTTGDVYHSDKVIAKPFVNFALSTSKSHLKPGDSCDLIFVFTPEEKGQINGSIRIATGRFETTVSVAGVVMRKKASRSLQ